MEAKARKWKGNWSRGICIFVAPTPDTKKPAPSFPFPPLVPCNLKTELTFLTMKMKICASCYLLRLQFSCSFFAQTKKYVGCASVCLGVCGFVKSASVISVRLNGLNKRGPKTQTENDRKLNLFCVGSLQSARKRGRESKTEREWVLEIK